MTYSKNNTVLTGNANFSGTLKANQYASTVTTVDARKSKKSVTIYGNAQALKGPSTILS